MVKLGIGVVGLDHWYTAFGVLTEASRGSKFKLVGVADKSRRRLAEIEAVYSPNYITTELEKVVSDPKIQLICTLSNSYDNVKLVKAALSAGKHVACVKPMAMKLKQADEMIEIAEREGRVLWCFDQLGRREAAALQTVLQRGLIGKPVSFHQVAWSGLPRPWQGKVGPSWWLDAKKVPFGAWADHAIYTIDMLCALFETEVVRVCGEIANKRYPRLAVEDYGIGTLELGNGLVAVLEHTWIGGPYHPLWTKIAGTEGVIHREPAMGEKTMLTTPTGTRPLKLAESKKQGILEAVFACIVKAQVNPSPARESRRNLAVAFGFYQSSKTGRYVRL